MDDAIGRVQVLGFAGSLREKSYNKALLRAAGEMLPEGMELEIYDLAGLPFYDADVEREGVPEAVQKFKRKIAEADALLIATPEYNYSFTAVTKNAIDWASRAPDKVLVGKPIALMGASTGNFGTTRSQHHLRQVFTATDSLVLVKPELQVIRAKELFDSEGKLTDETTRERLARLLESLAAWTRLHKGE